MTTFLQNLSICFASIFTAAYSTACLGPDRWHATAGHSEGDIDGKYKSWDTDENTIEVGLSGSLPWAHQPDRQSAAVEAQLAALHAERLQAAQTPPEGGFPTEEVVAALGLLLAAGGGTIGYKRYQARKAP